MWGRKQERRGEERREVVCVLTFAHHITLTYENTKTRHLPGYFWPAAGPKKCSIELQKKSLVAGSGQAVPFFLFYSICIWETMPYRAVSTYLLTTYCTVLCTAICSSSDEINEAVFNAAFSLLLWGFFSPSFLGVLCSVQGSSLSICLWKFGLGICQIAGTRTYR